MAYDKHTWACHEPITAEKLNHIEDGIANAGGDCDCGYECTEGWVTLTDESVTTAMEGGAPSPFGDLSYGVRITADEIKVTFNGVEYTCQKIGDAEYGAPYNGSTNTFDWSEYPFNILFDNGVNLLSTETAGTYQVKIETEEETITTAPCFEKAVEKISKIVVSIETSYENVQNPSHSAEEIAMAINNDAFVYLKWKTAGANLGWTPMYLADANWENATYDETIFGTRSRFSTMIDLVDDGNNNIIPQRYVMDIFNPDGTDEYYWVFDNTWSGRHE